MDEKINCKHIVNFVSKGGKLPDNLLALKRIIPKCNVCFSVIIPEDFLDSLLRTYETETANLIHDAFVSYHNAQTKLEQLSSRGVSLKLSQNYA